MLEINLNVLLVRLLGIVYLSTVFSSRQFDESAQVPVLLPTGASIEPLQCRSVRNTLHSRRAPILDK